MDIDANTAWKILKEQCSGNIIKHTEAVLNLILELAKRSKVELNLKIIKIGAILHDIGRSVTHNATHGVDGAKIAKSFNLPKEIVNLIERHVGGGISKEEAEKLGIPKKDYIQQTNEEKLLSYADNCIDFDQVIPIGKTIEKFAKKHGEKHSATKLLKKLKDDVEKNIL